MVCNNYSQNPSSMNDMHSSAPPKQTPTMDHGTAFNFWETLAAHCWTKTPPVQSVLHGAESWAPHDVCCRFRPPKRRGVPPGSHTWHYAHAQHRHFQPSSEVLCSRPALMINAKLLRKKNTRYVLGCKLYVILYANWIPAFGVFPCCTKNTKWRCIKSPLASIFVGFVRFKWSCSATHLLTKKGRIISPNMKNGNSTNDRNCHGKLLPQTLETTRSPILQVLDRGVYDSHYLNCSAMLGELLVPQPPTLSTLGFELTVTGTIPMARHPPTTPFLVQNATLTHIHA